ncbi:MAG: hypothetical protein Q9183_006017 [Haloplaca sp. 2 TL-2023]
MLVGGVRTDGSRWERSRRDPEESLDPKNSDFRVPVIRVHAPSVDLQVPDAITGGWRGPIADGTSYAAPAVAGLGAYFLGLSSRSQALADDDPFERVRKLRHMLEISTPIERVRGTGSLYNLNDPRACPPDVPLPDVPPNLNPTSAGGEEVGCRDASTTTSNTVVAVPSCSITTYVLPPLNSNAISFQSFPGTLLMLGIGWNQYRRWALQPIYLYAPAPTVPLLVSASALSTKPHTLGARLAVIFHPEFLQKRKRSRLNRQLCHPQPRSLCRQS